MIHIQYYKHNVMDKGVIEIVRTLNIIMFSTILVFASCSVVFAKSSVWKISKGDNHLYLGGTVHVLGEQDYPLPCEYQLAYDQSEQIVFETDFSALNSPEFAQKVALQSVYPQGQSLEDKLTPKTFQLLNEYLNSRGIPFQSVAQLKPGMLLSVITLVELQRLNISAKGVDQFYANLATTDKKPLGQLETPKQQIELIVNLGENNEEKFIQYLLESMSKFEQSFSEIKQAWRDGELSKLSGASEMDKIRTDFPRLFNDLFTERNNAWMPQIETMLENKEVEYVLVGALHLVEQEGLLAQLKETGFTLQQLSGCSAL